LENNLLLNAYFYDIKISKFYLNNYLHNNSNIIFVTKWNFVSDNKPKDLESEKYYKELRELNPDFCDWEKVTPDHVYKFRLFVWMSLTNSKVF